MPSAFVVPIALATSFALLLGCSSGDEKKAGPGAGHGVSTTTTSGSTSTDTGSGGAGGGGPCAPPMYGGGEKSQMVESANVDVVDGDGKLIPAYFVTLCGLDKCINGKTDDQGHSKIELFDKMKKPSIKLGDGAVHVKMAIPGGAAQLITLGQPIWLPELPQQGRGLVAGQTATSGDVSVTVATGATIEFEEEHYPTASMKELRSVVLPVEKSTALIDGQGIEILYGVGPQNTHICPPAAVSVPNSLGWTAGQEVDFYFHGVNTEQDFAPYSGWARISGGAVSADGKTIETSTGEGFPILGVFGVKRR